MFKNARLYRTDLQIPFDVVDLTARLATRRFRQCGPIEAATLGWVPPLGDDTEDLAHALGDCLLMCARKQERLLPPAAVAEAIDERVSEIESRDGRDVGRAERRLLREQIIDDLLPRARSDLAELRGDVRASI